MRAVDASVRLNEADKQQLHQQAFDQAEKFEVLNKRDVAALSRELRALDERCDYLRKTYKSLRAGRQKLHSRMISYLKRGETVIFSRESLLKQEEALAELDVSIDEFIHKLEQAENRRLRLRQKLLEHVAAALVLNPSASHGVDMAASTPPRSPIKAESPARVERKDVESIKIYADGHVLSLFSDIEQAIGKMCEQAC
jgi:predicted RNase H-like nuclease (RuvC/YqgF family)